MLCFGFIFAVACKSVYPIEEGARRGYGYNQTQVTTIRIRFWVFHIPGAVLFISFGSRLLPSRARPPFHFDNSARVPRTTLYNVFLGAG